MKLTPFHWALIVTVLLVGTLLMLNPHKSEIADSQLPWNSSYNSDGDLIALGLTLDKSTLKDAIDLYGRDIEVRIFDLVDGQRTAEAYIDSAFIGTIHAAMVFKLDLTSEELANFYARGARTTVTSQGAREVQLNSEDTLALFDFAIKEISIIPRRNLPAEAVLKRFGEPAAIVAGAEESIKSWIYPEKGLDLMMIEGDKEILRYSKKVMLP